MTLTPPPVPSYVTRYPSPFPVPLYLRSAPFVSLKTLSSERETNEREALKSLRLLHLKNFSSLAHLTQSLCCIEKKKYFKKKI